jgi:hypothetical protein
MTADERNAILLGRGDESSPPQPGLLVHVFWLGGPWSAELRVGAGCRQCETEIAESVDGHALISYRRLPDDYRWRERRALRALREHHRCPHTEATEVLLDLLQLETP